MKTERQMATAAAEFAERWKGRGYERGESQPFWIDLLTNVFGIETPSDGFITFEDHRMVDASNFIDGRIPSTRVLIEQKSLGKDLRKGIVQSDGSVLNPYQQARRYVVSLPVSEHPRWIVTCNFSEFLIYDMEQPNGEPEQILLENLGKEYYRLMFLVDTKNEHLRKEMEVSMQAGEIVGKIYDALLKSLTPNPSPKGDGSGYSHEQILHSLNQLCVQIVFCLYAEDAGVFNRDQFHDYLSRFDARDMRRALISLFEVLDTPYADRDPYLEEDLAAFPYVNGGLFCNYSPLSSERGKGVRLIPQFTEELKQTLLQNASLDFDWSEISPTIFGAVFESTLNPETRRSGGMHYTSIENIHKVIDPLFLNDLRRELDEILEEKIERQRQKKLDAFQDKLASLTFLDPACGSGNFLTETYLSLRRLENEVIRERYHGQTMMGEFLNPIKVSIQQFYGIEINDFAVTVATTALWISEAQMLAETERIIHQDIDFLPLKTYHNIREGNALRMDWDVIEKDTDIPTIHAKNVHLIIEPKAQLASESAVDYHEINVVTQRFDGEMKPDKQRYQIDYDYIIGNPPFVGYAYQTQEQKNDLANLMKGFGKNIDYVAGWYYKASQLINHTKTRCALVSTNSITQGEQVTAIWKPLFEKFGIHIDFAYRTFRWDSEASQKAHVHCVIIGFSSIKNERPLYIYEGEHVTNADNISPYLLNTPTVFIESRKKPLSSIPEITKGSIPVDGGNLIIEPDEYDDFVNREPAATKYIRRFLGAREFLHDLPRYCLWLDGASPKELNQMPLVKERIAKTREFRHSSTKAATRKYADMPTRFMEIRQPKDKYIIIPSHSSENRKYIPLGFMSPDVICGNANLMIPNAKLYHFGIFLTSSSCHPKIFIE